MNKASHIAYKKEFIDSFAGNLVKDCSKNIVNVS